MKEFQLIKRNTVSKIHIPTVVACDLKSGATFNITTPTYDGASDCLVSGSSNGDVMVVEQLYYISDIKDDMLNNMMADVVVAKHEWSNGVGTVTFKGVPTVFINEFDGLYSAGMFEKSNADISAITIPKSITCIRHGFFVNTSLYETLIILML